MKNNLNTKIDNIKFDFCKKSKFFLLGTAVVILIGLIVVACCGFNLGFDVTGGYAVQVKYDATQTDSFDKFMSNVEEIVCNKKVSIDITQKLGENNDQYVVIKYRAKCKDDDIEAKNTDIYNALVEVYGNDNVEDVAKIGSSFSNKTVLFTNIGLISVALVVFIYMAIRFHFSMGLATIFAFALDILLMLALTAICRFEVGGNYTTILGATGAMSLVFNSTLFASLRADNRKQFDKSSDNINLKIRNSIKFNFIMAVALLVIIFFTFYAVNLTAGFAIALILAMIVTLYTSTFISAPLWQMIYSDKSSAKITDKEQTV